jgi:imidazoleglycerol phosphate synthase glutamine amidotransferase subunit HisH
MSVILYVYITSSGYAIPFTYNILAALPKEDFNAIAQKIQDGISNAHQVILPGVGTFSTANLRFNAHSDFLCHLEYLPNQADRAGEFKQ